VDADIGIWRDCGWVGDNALDNEMSIFRPTEEQRQKWERVLKLQESGFSRKKIAVILNLKMHSVDKFIARAKRQREIDTSWKRR
jgi:hypothetical protein